MTSLLRGVAAREQFGATGEGIVWAVLDSGIDARHPHFQLHQNLTLPAPLHHQDSTTFDLDESASELEALVDLQGNGTFNAGVIAGEIRASGRVSLSAERKDVADLAEKDPPVVRTVLDAASGIAPRCTLLSLKVLGDDGQGRMSSVIKALKCVQDANRDAGRLLIHGVNISLWFDYDSERSHAV